LKEDKEGKRAREEMGLQWWFREEGKKRRWSKSDVCMGMPWGTTIGQESTSRRYWQGPE
jgi:hypothetical protein